ncbi:MAG: glycosyltransferase [Chthoniobacterales bacterium]
MTSGVSILIATCNRFDVLRQTLADLAAQSRPADEIIVVDQSRDANGQPLDQSDGLKDFPHLRYFHQTIQNAQVARNRAILEAKHPVLIMVDDDMRLPASFIEAHLQNYKDPEVDAVAGQVLKPGGKPTDRLPKEFSWIPDGWMLFPLNFSERRATINWPSCNASIRRDAAIAAGGFDEQFTRTWFDDTDFSWRLKQVGVRVVFDPKASAVHLKITGGGNRPGGVDALIVADANYWATILYFWRKNFGLLSVRRHFTEYLKRILCRKAFLLKPWAFLLALRELFAGYYLATRKLRQGPILPWIPQPYVRNKTADSCVS